MNGITKRDLAEWMESPVTRAWFKGIKAKMSQLEGMAGNGSMLNAGNPFETHSNISRVVGRIEGLNDALEIDDETVLGESE